VIGLLLVTPMITGAEAPGPGIDVQADIRRSMDTAILDRIRVRLVRVFKAGSRSTAKKGLLLLMVQVLGQKMKNAAWCSVLWMRLD